MTIREYTYLHFTEPTVPPEAFHGSRTQQLLGQASFAWHHMAIAVREGRPAVMRAMGQFLVASQALLSRWLDRRNFEEEESEQERERRRNDQIEWEATRRLLESRRDILELWNGIRQDVEKNFPE
jgi:hypothetical protein